MIVSIEYSEVAKRQIIEIYDFLADKVSENRAINVTLSITSTIDSLMIMPERCRQANFSEIKDNPLPSYIKQIKAGATDYMIYFRIVADTSIYIYAVINGKVENMNDWDNFCIV